jgi:serine/threonine protein kinase
MDSAKASNSLRAIFDQAVELPGSQRDEFLKTACGPDMKLRAAVESLLAAHDRAGSFLADPVIAPNLLQAREILSPNSRIDRYTLIRVLGEGGYGTVYLAEQDPPLRRRVALKVIKPGMDTRQVIARFELERQALAMMDHPNIAKVFDAGSTNTGLPYFAMELVDGIPITKFCRSYEIDIQARLRLFISVCAAVQHAHEKGVIHRDLKPGNILVAFQDGNPMPKIIDFGTAKAKATNRSRPSRRFLARRNI